AKVIRLSPGAQESNHLVPPGLHPKWLALRQNGPDDSGSRRDSRGSKLCSRLSGELRPCGAFVRIAQRRLTNIQTRPASAELRCLQTTRSSKPPHNALFLRKCFGDPPG